MQEVRERVEKTFHKFDKSNLLAGAYGRHGGVNAST